VGEVVVWPVAVLAVLGFFGWVRAWALDRRVRALEQGRRRPRADPAGARPLTRSPPNPAAADRRRLNGSGE
jgi:hypothetical protein